MDDTKTLTLQAEVVQTSATLPLPVLQALRGVSALQGISQSQIITEALLQDARIVLEMALREKAAK